MSEEFEIRAEWWLPESPSDRVAGVVRYALGERPRLALDRPILEHWVEDGSGGRSYSVADRPLPVILGTGPDGSGLALIEGAEFGATILADSLLTGRFWKPEANPRFECAEIRISRLEEWSEHSPFALPLPDLQRLGEHAGLVTAIFSSYPIPALEGPDPYEMRVSYGRKALVAVEVPSWSCKVEIWSMTAPSVSLYKSASVEHGILVYIQPSAPQDVSWYTKLLGECVDLFSFLVGRRTYPTKATLFSTQHGAPVSQCEVGLFDHRSKPSQAETPRPEEMPLPLTFVQPVAQQAFEAWFSNAEKIKPVHQLLLETLPPDDADLESVTLRLAQAVEVFFYSRPVGQTYVQPETYDGYYDAMLRALPQGVPSPLRDRLREYLKGGNKCSLRSAIERLIKALGEPARRALRVDNISKFASLVANTRNFLTHRTKRKDPAASSAREYLELNRTLRALLYGALAEDMGFADSAVAQCVSKVRAGV